MYATALCPKQKNEITHPHYMSEYTYLTVIKTVLRFCL